jgi:hypothetical protein
MEDQSENIEEKPSNEGKLSLSSEQIVLGDDKLEGLGKDKIEHSQPKIKLQSNEKDAEMMKPAESSDSELIDENEVSSLVAQEKEEKKVEQSLQELEDESADLELQEMLTSKEKLDRLLEKECLEQDKKIQRALDREREMRQRLKDGPDKGAGAVNAGAPPVSEQTKELLAFDLEELIKEQGEDVDFEFYFEGKLIQPH